MNNYHIEFDYFGEHYSLDCIAFDRNITYEDCLTIYVKPNFRIVCNLDNCENLKYKAIK